MSVECGCSLLALNLHRTNLGVGFRNRYGKNWQLGFDIEALGSLKELHTSLALEMPGQLTHWICLKNQNQSQIPTKASRLRVYAIPAIQQQELWMQPYSPPKKSEKRPLDYLASAQGTKYAVTKIFTSEERKLFHNLRKAWRDRTPIGDPGYSILLEWTHEFNKRADGLTTNCKSFKHVKKYFYSELKKQNCSKHHLITTQ